MGLIWSILIATHASRGKSFGRLVAGLGPQLVDGVEVVVYWNRGSLTIGEYRQALLQAAVGEYVSYVDDDDRLPTYFCDEVMRALECRPDYVGFEVAFSNAGGITSEKPRYARAFHSLDYDGWYRVGGHFMRDVTHLNPIRRDIATKGRFVGVRGEDRDWATVVRPFVKSQIYVDRVMYFYDFDDVRSIRGGSSFMDEATRPVLPDGFRYHPNSDR